MTNITQTDLKAFFVFPFKGEKWQEKFAVGTLITFAGLIIPLLPWFLIQGYIARAMRGIIKDKKPPSMPAWDGWDELFVDGAKLLGVSLIYALPVIVMLFIGWMLMFVPMLAIPLLEQATEQGSPLAFLSVLGGSFGGMAGIGIAMLFSLAMSVFVPVATAHAVANNSFSAAFRIREWWGIFRANWSGFAISYALMMGTWMAAMLVMQVLYMTIIFCCLQPLLFAPLGFYGSLLMNMLFAQAYAEGQEKLGEENVYYRIEDVY